MQKLLLLTIALIVYGSLYPWEFRSGPAPLLPPLDSWNGLAFNRFSLRDLLINVVLYIPVGFFAHLSLARAGMATRFFGPLVLGASLSAVVEVAQMFTARRHTSSIDVIANTIGTAVGVVLALAARELAYLPAMRARFADRGAVALLAAGVAYLLYPFFPIFGRTALAHKLKVFMHSEWFEPMTIVSTAIAWFVAGRLLAVMNVRSAPVWLAAAAVFALPVQLLVLTRQPLLPHVTGAAVGVLLFFWRYNHSSARFDAWAVWFVVVLRGLVPFRLASSANAFTWSPFGGALGFSDWQRAVLIITEKTFFYGAAIWAIHRSGAELWKATAITTGTLAAIEIVQIYLPGRTPEITDIVLTVIIGAGSYWAGHHATAGKA